MDCKNEDVPELLRGVGFCLLRDGPGQLKEQACMCSLCTQMDPMCKSILMLSHWSYLKILFYLRILILNRRKLWDPNAATVVKNYDTPRQNMHLIYAVVLSIVIILWRTRSWTMRTMTKSNVLGIHWAYWRLQSSWCTQKEAKIYRLCIIN